MVVSSILLDCADRFGNLSYEGSLAEPFDGGFEVAVVLHG